MFKSQCQNPISSGLFYNFHLLKSSTYNGPLFWDIIEPDREEGKVRASIQNNSYVALNDSTQNILEMSALEVNSDNTNKSWCARDKKLLKKKLELGLPWWSSG